MGKVISILSLGTGLLLGGLLHVAPSAAFTANYSADNGLLTAVATFTLTPI